MVDKVEVRESQLVQLSMMWRYRIKSYSCNTLKLKALFYFAALFLNFLTVNAQEDYIIVHLHNGREDAYPINAVDSVTFTRSTTAKNSTSQYKRLKILCIGNSFTLDAMSYAPFILKDIAPEVELTIGCAYIGGACLAQQLASITGSTIVLDNNTYSPKDYIFYLYENNANRWTNKGEMNAPNILDYTDWDIITLQQLSSQSWQDYETFYSPVIHKLQMAIAKRVHNIQLGWILTSGANSQDESVQYGHWEKSAQNSYRVMNETGMSVLFCYGTAIQNLRTTDINERGDGGGFTADGSHLQEGIGCLCASYCMVVKMLEIVGYNSKTIIGNTIRPNRQWINERNVPEKNYGESGKDGVIGITERNCLLAQIAAIQACKSPFLVSNIDKP